MAYSDGDDFISGAILSFQQANRMKNNWRAAAPPTNPSGGMLHSDSDDDKLYHWGTAAWIEIMQVGILSDLETGVTIGGAYIYRVGGTDVAVADGGTNIGSYAIGDLLYASAAGVLSKLAAVAVGKMIISKGVATAPEWSDSGILKELLLSGQSMITESAGNEGKITYANDTNRKAVGGRALEMIVKSPDDANYYREILSNRQECIKLATIITYP